MIRLIVLFSIISLALGASFRKGLIPMLDGRIVGGLPASVGQFPYQVSMSHFGSHHCGGSIVTNSKIVTAAHCTHGTVASNVGVRAGSIYHKKGGVHIMISEYVEYPEYDIPFHINNDIALLFLSTPLVFSATIAAIPLPLQGATVEPGTVGPVSGWGVLKQASAITPYILQYVHVPYVDLVECQRAYADLYVVTPQMLCAGFIDGGRDSCHGDSGGPLIFNGALHGVVSWGQGCALPNYPGVYARAAIYIDWINSY